jgi:molybdopterin molybdotransferase
MAAASETNPIIARLTPLSDVLALIEAQVQPVAPRKLALGHALHAILAEDVIAPAQPAKPLALIDGWALAANATRDAGGYAPAPLPQMPVRVEAGSAMPAGTDSVAPLDAVKVSNGRAEALAPVNPGDGVLPAGADCDGKTPLRRAGARLRAVDVAALTCVGVSEVNVRTPRLRMVPVRNDRVIGNAAQLIEGDAVRFGATANVGDDLSAALSDADADAIVAIGGTGSGRNDNSVRLLARAGKLSVHGIALTPGETAAFGFVGNRPVLLLPGRLDAALAVWLTVGRPLLRRLAASAAQEAAQTLTLSRKVASTVGLAELIPARRSGDSAEPLASKYLPFSALSRADGFILVPAESEGYSAGASVSVSPWL